MKNPSLNDYADMIISQVQSGLKSVSNHGLSRSQVKDEFIQARERMIPEAIAGGLVNPQMLYQDLILEKFEKYPESAVSNRKATYTSIPQVLEIETIRSVEFLGSTDGFEGYKVVTGTMNQFVGYDRFTSKAPTGWIKGNKIVVYNGLHNRLLLRAIFSNPRDLQAFDPVKYSDDRPFAVPPSLGDMIVGKLVNDYYRYYRMANPQPNTQTEINQQPQQ